MHAAGHQADIAKTNENQWCLLILEGRRLANAHFGRLVQYLAHFESLGELLAGLLGGWVAALMGCLLLAGRLAGLMACWLVRNEFLGIVWAYF